MQHIVEFAFSSFQKWGHIDPNRSGIGLSTISNTRATFAYHCFYDNLRLYQGLRFPLARGESKPTRASENYM